MKTKKILAAVLSAAMAFTLAGCGDSTKPAAGNSGTAGESGTAKNSLSTEQSFSMFSTWDPAPITPDPEPISSAPAESEPVILAKDIDWSIIPEVDILDIHYEKRTDGELGEYVLITEYFGDAEYIKLPETIEGISKIAVVGEYNEPLTWADSHGGREETVNWGENAKAIKFPEGIVFGDYRRISYGCDTHYGAGAAANATCIVLPDTLEKIHYFYGLISLPEITLPNNLKTVGKKTFKDCPKLKSVTFGENIKEIGYEAFIRCTALETVTFPDKFKSEKCLIDTGAFKECISLKSIDLPEGITFIDAMNQSSVRVFENCINLESVTLPSDMTVIGSTMFSGCKALKEIKLPDTLTEIRSFAFDGCTSLKTIDIPESVTSIDAGAFNNCTDITINFKGRTFDKTTAEKLYDRDLSII